MEENKTVNQNIYENILIAVAIMLYFIIINFAYCRIETENVVIGLKIVSMIILFLSIIIFEIAYKKDNGRFAIHGIETLVLAAHALSILQVVEILQIEFTTYILISSFTFAVYYILKATILHTIDKRKYLKSLSDIREIVNNEPVKKEATKKEK